MKRYYNPDVQKMIENFVTQYPSEDRSKIRKKMTKSFDELTQSGVFDVRHPDKIVKFLGDLQENPNLMIVSDISKYLALSVKGKKIVGSISKEVVDSQSFDKSRQLEDLVYSVSRTIGGKYGTSSTKPADIEKQVRYNYAGELFNLRKTLDVSTDEVRQLRATLAYTSNNRRYSTSGDLIDRAIRAHYQNHVNGNYRLIPDIQYKVQGERWEAANSEDMGLEKGKIILKVTTKDGLDLGLRAEYDSRKKKVVRVYDF